MKIVSDFNEKWKSYLLNGAYGLNIEDERVVRYLDDEFEKEVKINPKFQYRQIKVKCGTCRVYANSLKDKEWEAKVDEIINSNSYFK